MCFVGTEYGDPHGPGTSESTAADDPCTRPDGWICASSNGGAASELCQPVCGRATRWTATPRRPEALAGEIALSIHDNVTFDDLARFIRANSSWHVRVDQGMGERLVHAGQWQGTFDVLLDDLARDEGVAIVADPRFRSIYLGPGPALTSLDGVAARW